MGSSRLLKRVIFEGVILSEAKDLLFACAENKADPSVAQNRRNLRMTLQNIFPHPPGGVKLDSPSAAGSVQLACPARPPKPAPTVLSR
jgi:hypothetical protein